MNPIYTLFIILFSAASLFNGTEALYTNFKIRKLGVCNNTQLDVKFYANVIDESGKQYLALNATMPFSTSDTIGGVCIIQTKSIGNGFTELFTIREKNFCKALNKYLGEFWYDIERQIQMTPGVCPMQKGTYGGNHILLRFEKISLQTFPFGTLRFTFKAIDRSTQRVLWCILCEVDNVIN